MESRNCCYNVWSVVFALVMAMQQPYVLIRVDGVLVKKI